MYGDPIFQNIEDNLDQVHNRFMHRRTADLFNRFNGWYRSIVEETNDPLQIRRVRVRIPELHDNDVEVKDLPWAVPAPWMGGQNTGSWSQAMIKDQVFVCFEKNHPYAPVYCAMADPTRRRMYTMWSIYTKSPQAVDESGKPADTPTEFLEEYLPKDGRPMNIGFSDRYGNFLNFSAYGFAPKTHKVDPAAVGTDALAKSDYMVNKDQPKDNEPDLKYLTMGTKYGHMSIFADQGYKWFKEFKGDFEEDKDFEEKRYKYLLKYFNEQEPKDRDQRRIDIRTRAGHKFEMRDVGWDKSRSGEYGDQVEIGDSKDRDERWWKLRSKGGHFIQAFDKGADPIADEFYKRLNKTEFGDEVDGEDDFGEDARFIRLVTRHGNQLYLDDRGSSPTSGDDATPHGNGVLLRSRKGFQLQMCDKPEKDSIMMVTPKDQCFEINDRFQYVLLTTTQSGELHKDLTPEQTRTRPRYVTETGETHDPLHSTYHLKLDKQAGMVRLKTPGGAGIEAKGPDSPCGEWVETRDSENRAVWMSKKDQILLIRGKKGTKYILLDDNDDVILIRNEDGRIQIRAKKNIEIKSDEGNICLEAPNGEIGFKAKKMAAQTAGAGFIWDGSGFGTDKDIVCETMDGFHKTVLKPKHPDGKGHGDPAGRGGTPCKVEPKDPPRKKPDDFDKERGCDDQKPEKGSIPPEIFDSPPGGGGGGGGPSPSNPPPPSPFAPTEPGADIPPPPPPVEDPIEESNPGGGGVLWYGLSNKFVDEIKGQGLLLGSFANNLNIPPLINATEIHLAKTLEIAQGKTQAILSQRRYGDRSLILRIRNVPDGSLLTPVPGNDDIVSYPQDIPFEANIEIFEVGTIELSQPPLFPDV